MAEKQSHAGPLVAVVGLGYVGLPLALALGARYRTIGYDRDASRVATCRESRDPTGELAPGAFEVARLVEWTSDPAALGSADVVIVAVPTPVDAARRPDFGPLLDACDAVGRVLRRGATVVFESTVYPGATEELCVPRLEAASGLAWKSDFFVGYSPERINPGDPEHSLARVTKIVSGDSARTLALLAELYGSIVSAGVHRASSIRVAEAAKAIENTQRDLNIALMNELSLIFHRLDLDTDEVLRAASTKWNFLPFRPGLVGGHCIGVDPYYLTHKSEMVGYHPEMILAGRRINDGMASFVAQETIKRVLAVRGDTEGRPVGITVGVLGLTFKENCSDLRHSQAVTLVRELEAYGARVFALDPRASAESARREHDLEMTAWSDLPRELDALVLAVPHSEYVTRSLPDLLGFLRPGALFVDVKSAFPRDEVTRRGYGVFRL